VKGRSPAAERSEHDGGPQRQDPAASTGMKGFLRKPMIAGRQVPAVGAAMLIITLIGCQSGTDKLYKESKIVMGTVVEITVAHRSEDQARVAIREAMAEFQRIDDLMSSYKPDSVVSRVNLAGSTVKVPVGEEVFQILQDAVDISAASGGAFDATIWPVSKIWDFNDGGVIPERDKMAIKLELVGYRNLEFDNSMHSVGFAIDGMGLDLGAIAKGWAVDRAMEKIMARGIRNAIIDAGGDLKVIGTRPGKNFWRIGVQHPRDPGVLLMTFELRDTAIVTSGDYERFFMAGGVRYHHILDPATGQPARGCQSVTVLAPTAAEADACATAAFVLGPSKGLAFLRSRPGVRGVVVGADGELLWTDEALALMAHR
jgi:thiamine biosynthesis lipoprotein